MEVSFCVLNDRPRQSSIRRSTISVQPLASTATHSQDQGDWSQSARTHQGLQNLLSARRCTYLTCSNKSPESTQRNALNNRILIGEQTRIAHACLSPCMDCLNISLFSPEIFCLAFRYFRASCCPDHIKHDNIENIDRTMPYMRPKTTADWAACGAGFSRAVGQ
jgi:hypothetical protein